MRELYYTIPNLVGFAPDTVNPTNSRFMTVGKNGRILPNGVETTGPPMYFAEIDNPQWPFPQGIVAWDSFLLFHKDTVRRMVRGGMIGGLLKGFDECNHPWSFAIFKDRVLACNAKTLVYVGAHGHPEVWGAFKQQAFGVPVGTCVTAYNGQLFVGAPWAYTGQKKRWVMWSRVGAFDSRLERDDSFEAGYYVTEYGDEIRALYSFESGVLAFSNVGVTHLTPVPHPHMYMGRTVTRKVGIAGPLAVCGDKRMCMFLGTDGNMYSYTSDGHFERMGYRDTLDLPENSCPVLSYNIERSEVYIGY